MEVLLCPFWSISHPNIWYTQKPEECHPLNLEATACMGTFQIQPRHSSHGASDGDPRWIQRHFIDILSHEGFPHRRNCSPSRHYYFTGASTDPRSSPHSTLNCVLTFQCNGSPLGSWETAFFSFLRNLYHYECEVDHILFANLVMGDLLCNCFSGQLILQRQTFVLLKLPE